jgi:MFS family permease
MEARNLPPVFWTLWAGTLINRIGGFVVPFLALYLTGTLKLSVATVGLIVSLLGAGSIAASLVGGVLADTVGRRTTMLLSLITTPAAMVALGFARHPVAIGANVLILGFVMDLYRPAMSAMVADIVPPGQRLRAYGLIYWAVNLGFSIAPVLAGLISRWSYLALFIGDAITTFVYAIVVYLRVPETLPARTPEARRRPGPGLEVVLRDRWFILFVSLNVLTAFVFHQGYVTLPVDMRAHGVEPHQFGMIIAVNGLLIVVLQPFAGEVLGRFPRMKVLAVASLLAGVGFGMNGFVHTVPLYVLSVVVWTLGEIASSPTTSAIVADVAPAAMRGRYQGVMSMSWSAATLTAPTLGALVLGKAGGMTLWMMCFGLTVLAAAGLLFLGDVRKRH